jgi:phage-related protein
MPLKPLGWIGTAKDDLLSFPESAVREIGHALYVAQLGGKHPSAKPLKGFGGASLMEVVEDHDGDSYRAVYTVRFAEVVYVLHTFQKKSKSGIATPLKEVAKVKARLKLAEEEYERWLSAKA